MSPALPILIFMGAPPALHKCHDPPVAMCGTHGYPIREPLGSRLLYFAAPRHDKAPARRTRRGLRLCALGRIRTCNLLIRSQMLYPLSYECLCFPGGSCPCRSALREQHYMTAAAMRNPFAGPRRDLRKRPGAAFGEAHGTLGAIRNDRSPGLWDRGFVIRRGGGGI